MLGWKGLVLGIPKMCCRTCVDLFRLDFELWVVVVGWGGLSKGINLFSRVAKSASFAGFDGREGFPNPTFHLLT